MAARGQRRFARYENFFKNRPYLSPALAGLLMAIFLSLGAVIGKGNVTNMLDEMLSRSSGELKHVILFVIWGSAIPLALDGWPRLRVLRPLLILPFAELGRHALGITMGVAVFLLACRIPVAFPSMNAASEMVPTISALAAGILLAEVAIAVADRGLSKYLVSPLKTLLAIVSGWLVLLGLPIYGALAAAGWKP